MWYFIKSLLMQNDCMTGRISEFGILFLEFTTLLLRNVIHTKSTSCKPWNQLKTGKNHKNQLKPKIKSTMNFQKTSKTSHQSASLFKNTKNINIDQLQILNNKKWKCINQQVINKKQHSRDSNMLLGTICWSANHQIS